MNAGLLRFFRYASVFIALATASSFPANAQDTGLLLEVETSLAADTTDLFVRRQEAILERARVELAVTGWRRLLPSVRFNLTFSNQSLLFSPVTGATDASLWQPAGNWTLTLSLPIGELFDPLPRWRSRADVRVATANRDWALRERIRAKQETRLKGALLRLQAEHLALLLQILIDKRLMELELLKLAELKYAQGELSFEGLAAAKLRMLELDRQIAVARHNLNAAQLTLERTP